MGITRRILLKGGALAVVGTAAIPHFLSRSVFAEAVGASGVARRGKRLVVIFQRGAVDGLNMVVPHGESAYYALRPTIAIPEGAALDLDGFFGLHPEMAALKPLYDSRHLAIIHAAGSPDTTRSHFDAQDYMESGTPGVKATPDGWLNRALAGEPLASGSAASPFRAVAMGEQVPRTLAGPVPAVALGNLQDFSIAGLAPSSAGQGFAAMYAGSVSSVLHGTGAETFEAIKMLKDADPARYTPAPGAAYPKSPFGHSMRQIAQLLKADLGVEAAFADIGGWDTHQNQGGVNGQLAGRLRDFSEGLAAFWTDLGDGAADVVVVTMSEFGRTAHQNGTGGTDHGHANAMLVLGGPVRGGRVYGRWPGLAPEQLNEGRDLAITTDYRLVLRECIAGTLRVRDMDRVFPGATGGPAAMHGTHLGLI